MSEPAPERARDKFAPLMPVRGLALARQVAAALHFDSAVAFGILARVWAAATGPITVLLVAAFFTPEVQGYFYTFYSLIAAQVLLELGLGRVIIQFAAHEWSRLERDADGRIAGDAGALSRLASLARFGLVWFAVAAALLVPGLLLLGWVFFGGSAAASAAAGNDVVWWAPWVAISLAAGLDLALMPLVFLLEGCNQVRDVYLYRFVRAVLNSLLLWCVIVLGGNLWATPASLAVAVLWTLAFLWWGYWPFFRVLLARHDGPRIAWRADLWPMQWRIAVSWLSGYLAFFLFTPVLFKFHGPVAAGQMGMTWALVLALQAVSTMFVQTKAPHFGMLIAKRDFVTLDRLSLRVGVVSVATCLLGAITVLLGLALLDALDHPLSERLLPIRSASLFLAATVILQITIPQAVYLRAHKREPFLTLSVVGGGLIGLSTVVLGYHWSALGMGVGYLGVTVFVSLPWATMVFFRCRRLWHA